MIRIGILEADHWHVPGHLKAIGLVPDVRLVAVSGTGTLTAKIAEDYRIPAYQHYKELLDAEKPDLVYIFGVHRECPVIMEEVIRRGIPFMVEKPGAADADQLEPLLAAIDRKRLPHAVPLLKRVSPIVTRYKDAMREAAEGGGLHLLFRYITGGPDRYLKWECPWMLRRAEAGGGALINLGPHYIDLVRYLTGEEIVQTGAVVNRSVWDTEVDDYAALVLKTTSGTTATVEVGYTNPGPPEETFCMTGRNFYIVGKPGESIKRYSENGTVEEHPFPHANLYRDCLASLIAAMEGKGEPVATLEDCYKSLCVIKQAYRQNGW